MTPGGHGDGKGACIYDDETPWKPFPHFLYSVWSNHQLKVLLLPVTNFAAPKVSQNFMTYFHWSNDIIWNGQHGHFKLYHLINENGLETAVITPKEEGDIKWATIVLAILIR